MNGLGINPELIKRRVRACDYLTVAQLFLQKNFLLKSPLIFDDIKPRLLGHWGTCHGINLAYANLKAFYQPSVFYQLNLSTDNAPTKTTAPIQTPPPNTTHADDPNFSFVLGPGHGFPALQANLFIDGDLLKIDAKAERNLSGIEYICRNFSWPGGFPSHASPITPGVISEGGELGYALATAYGAALNQPQKTLAVLIGDGELETATALSSLNLNKLLATAVNGKVLPILHLNGYKISAPTISARKSDRELNELIRGFGYTPIFIDGEDVDAFQSALDTANCLFDTSKQPPFLVMKTEKGHTGPAYVDGQKVAGNYLSHQIPLKNAKTDLSQLAQLETWLKSYHFEDLFSETKGFTL